MEIEKIADRLYEALVPGARQIKIAKLIGDAFPDLNIPDDDLVDAALDLLAQRSDIETFGNFHRWRHSERKRNGTHSN